jgi:hypothetical protein
MKAGIFQRLVLMVGLIATAGCGGKQPGAKELRSPSGPAQPFIFYDPNGDPSEKTPELSKDELQGIVAWVATQTPEPVWLIRVEPGPEVGKRGRMIAYLVPYEMTPRIRMGHAYYFEGYYPRAAVSLSWKYAQISMPDHSFKDRLTKPPLNELPFEWYVVAGTHSTKGPGVSEEEMIAIADFVRRPSSYKHLEATSDRMSKQEMIDEILASPIFEMERKGNEINVRFGSLHGPHWGYGMAVTLEYMPTGYKVTRWGTWIS